MVNFEDGTLVEGAYVEIGGVKYPVQLPKFEGNTPVSAENLNKMQKDFQDNLNKLQDNVESAIKDISASEWVFDFREVGKFDVSASEAIIGYEYADLPKTLEHKAVVIPICSWFKASTTASLYNGNCINVFITNYQIHGETAYHGVRALLIYPKSLLN